VPELGGYVFWLTADGKHGLVAETQDQGFASWYGAEYLLTVRANHSTIGANFIDWRLPNIEELREMYSNRDAIGTFINASYWSSTEVDATNAYSFLFPLGNATFTDKNLTSNVRGVRAF
jgi:hypothetical protein